MVAVERFRNSSACRGRRPSCRRNCSRRPCWTRSRRACWTRSRITCWTHSRRTYWTRSRRTVWTSEPTQRINSNVILETVLLINGCVTPPLNARMDLMSTTVPVQYKLSFVPTDSVLVSTCHALESMIAGITQMRRFVSAMFKSSNVRRGNALLSTSSAMGSMTTEIDQTKISVICSNSSGSRGIFPGGGGSRGHPGGSGGYDACYSDEWKVSMANALEASDNVTEKPIVSMAQTRCSAQEDRFQEPTLEKSTLVVEAVVDMAASLADLRS